MQSETGFPSSHQLKSYVASKCRLKLATRAVLSADAGLLVQPDEWRLSSTIIIKTTSVGNGMCRWVTVVRGRRAGAARHADLNWKLYITLRSIAVVNWWSRDGNHEFTTCEWNALLSPAYFFHEVVNSGCMKVTRVHEFVNTTSRVHELNGTLFTRSWTRDYEFTSSMERSISNNSAA